MHQPFVSSGTNCKKSLKSCTFYKPWYLWYCPRNFFLHLRRRWWVVLESHCVFSVSVTKLQVWAVAQQQQWSPPSSSGLSGVRTWCKSERSCSSSFSYKKQDIFWQWQCWVSDWKMCLMLSKVKSGQIIIHSFFWPTLLHFCLVFSNYYQVLTASSFIHSSS